MATQKELEITQALIAVAIAANASNEDVNVAVNIRRASVQVMISPDKEVANESWDWLFYPEFSAYFSTDVFDEETFVSRCDVFMAEISKHMISHDADGVPV